jgi:SAM-dependent methyltransferase
MPAMAKTDRDWDQRYRDRTTPWDSGLPSKELRKVLAEVSVPRGHALDLGCGTGTNSVFLSDQGFRVTGVDCSPTALDLARQKMARAGVEVEWVEADVQRWGAGRAPFDFIFDRGCYHCCRGVDREGYLETLRNVTKPGTILVCLAGNADETTPGPPRVMATDLCTDFEPMFRVLSLRPFRFEDPEEVEGPLGWSFLGERRTTL